MRSAGSRYHCPTAPPLGLWGRGGSPGRLADKHARFHNMCIQQLNKLCLTTSVHSDFLLVENRKRLQGNFSRHVPPKLDKDLEKKAKPKDTPVLGLCRGEGGPQNETGCL